MYNSRSMKATEFISHDEILSTLEYAKQNSSNRELIDSILEKAANYEGLDYREVAVLLRAQDSETVAKIHATAAKIKEHIYGNRIVMFAPLYLSNYCVNECRYCGYHNSNCEMTRKKLTQEEIEKEVIALQDMGHKRLALELGEDPVNSSLEYLLESIKTIYSIKHDNGEIRRVNVNIAATSVEDYRKLKEAGIGTYILFQETYNRDTYEYMHPKGPKHNYAYHTEAMDRAMEAGLDDVGIGVLLGLHDDYHYDAVGMMLHVKHLEDTFGVGPHTMSFPRIRAASEVELSQYSGITDEKFYNLVAIFRLAVPYTGIIISTRETMESRADLLKLGVSQLSGGSCTGVGGYDEMAKLEKVNTSQFDVEDHRTLDEITLDLAKNGYIPSFCTACYREGRTGDRFMALAKVGQIGNVCQPNALMTLQEYLMDYASPETKEIGEKVIREQAAKIPNPEMKKKTEQWLERIRNGERDFRV